MSSIITPEKELTKTINPLSKSSFDLNMYILSTNNVQTG